MSPSAYAQRYLKRMVPFAFAPMHNRWDQIVGECEEAQPLRIIRAHRDSAKTTYWEIIYVLYRLSLWLWLHNQGQTPDERIIMLGSGDEAAEASARQVRFELETNKLIARDFRPRKGKPWTDAAFSLAGAGDVKNPTVRARGLTSIKPGPRANCIIAGDVVQPQHVYSIDQRDKDQRAWEEVVRPMMNDSSVAIINGTTFHSDDLLGRLQKDQEYVTETFPLVIDEESKRVSWPERFTWGRVIQLKKKPLVFSRQYQLEEVPEGERLIPMPEMFMTQRVDHKNGAWFVDGERCRVVGSMDPAYTERKVNRGARTAIITALYKQSKEEAYIVDVRAVHYGPDKVMEMLDMLWRNWGHEAIWVEEVGLQTVFRKLMTKSSAIPLLASEAQGDKMQRITGTLSAPMSNHKLFYCSNNILDGSQIEEAVREANEFPGQQVDTQDAMEHLIRNLHKSPRFRAGPRTDSVVRNVRMQAKRQNWLRTGIGG